jgi:glycosyltransferase involved in cell wall biosynthesis
MRILAHDAHWQEPARTERHAFELLRQTAAEIPGALYLGFPWATLIDATERGTPQADLLQTELHKLSARRPDADIVVTVCQHIKYAKYLEVFRRAGVTELYCAHAQRGVCLEGGIRIWPFSLFAVQRPTPTQRSDVAQTDAAAFLARDLDFSYMGAFAARYYLTNVRELIVETLSDAPRAHVQSRGEWHYERQVYKQQIQGEALQQAELGAQQERELEYRDVMSRSRFALCPSGTGPNSIRFWEAIEFGCIPVLLADTLALPGPDDAWDRAIVRVPESREGVARIPSIIAAILADPAEVEHRLQALAAIRLRHGTDHMTDLLLERVAAQARAVRAAARRPGAPFVVVDGRGASAEVLDHCLSDIRHRLRSSGIRQEPVAVDAGGRLWRDGRPIGELPGGAPLDLVDTTRPFAVVRGARGLTVKLLAGLSQWVVVATDPVARGATPVAADPVDDIRQRHGDFDVTLISSVFRGRRFLPAFLASAAQYDIRDRIEQLMIIAASPEDDLSPILQAASSDGAPNLVVVHLPSDPGLYEVWNLGVSLASGRVLGNANLDDFRAPDQVRTLLGMLDADPAASVASAAISVSDQPDGDWTRIADQPAWFAEPGREHYAGDGLFRVSTDGSIRSHNIPHCVPLWRWSLHATFGYFDERRYGPSADWEFWLRCAGGGARFRHSSRVLGLYYRNPNTYWRRNPDTQRLEQNIVLEHFDGSRLLGRHDGSDPMMAIETLSEHVRRRSWWSVLVAACDVVGRHRGRMSGVLRAHLEATLAAATGLDGKLVLDLLSSHCRSSRSRGQAPVAVLARLAEAAGAGSGAAGVVHRLGLIAEEAWLRGEAQAALLVLAKLAWRGRRREAFHALVDASRRTMTAEAHWRACAQIFGADVPLETLRQAAGSLVPKADFNELRAASRVYSFPDYSAGNSYQRLLYDAIGIGSDRLTLLPDVQALLALAPADLPPGAALHLHWINAIDSGLPHDERAARLRATMQHLEALKQAGVAIVWTVHNACNHEPADVEAELAFRRRLAELVDVVYVHHPAIPALFLPWWPEQARAQYYEHGPYEIPSTASKAGRPATRKQHGIATDAIVGVLVGQVRPYKGLHRLLPGLIASLDAHADLHVVIAGRINCPATQARLKTLRHPRLLVIDRRLSDDEVHELHGMADFGLLSYERILTSGGLFAALSHRLPVVAPQVGTLPFYVIDGVTGWNYDGVAEFEQAVDAAVWSLRERRACPAWRAAPTTIQPPAWPGQDDAPLAMTDNMLPEQEPQAPGRHDAAVTSD